MAVISASVALGLIYDTLNVSTIAYNTFNDDASGPPRWQQAALVNFLVDADLEIQRVCASSPNSSYRNSFISPTPATIAASGDPLPASMIGPPQSVFVTGTDTVSRPARPGSSVWIDYYRNDPQGVFGPAGATDRTYAEQDGRLYFKGTLATVNYCIIARATVPALPALPTLFAPEAFTNAAVKAVCGWCAMKESEYLQEAQGWLTQYYSDLKSIEDGAMSVPPIETLQLAGA